jgi:cellulose synthase/poly-beta-1,6-N-acetylglucosamine synthase-like glycosyltransferase
MQVCVIIPSYSLNLKKIEKILRNVKSEKFKIFKIVLFIHKFRKFELEKIKSLKITNLKIFIEKRRIGKIGVLKKALSFIKKPSIVAVINGDIQIKKYSFENLLAPYLTNKKIGATTGRGILKGKYNPFLNFFNNFTCELQHACSKKETRLSQFYSFKYFGRKIPSEIVSDEAFIEAVIKKFGLKNFYAENAIFYYSAPNSVSKLFEQRRRNFIGNLQVKTEYHHNVSTIFPLNKFTLKIFLFFFVRNPIFMFFSVFLELLARSKAMFDYFVLGERPYKWKIVTE